MQCAILLNYTLYYTIDFRSLSVFLMTIEINAPELRPCPFISVSDNYIQNSGELMFYYVVECVKYFLDLEHVS